jgi:hypothetical protein
MTKMKTNIYKHGLIMLAVVVGISNMTSCNDDTFLEEKTESSYTLSNAFETTSQVNACLTELYLQFKEFRFPGYREDCFFTGIGTDVFEYRPNMTPIFSDFTNWTSTWYNIENRFQAIYKLISKANLVLLGAEKVSWNNESDKAYVTAQAKFIRGICYMWLGEIWGGVPLVDTYRETPKLDFQRATREETYQFAIDDLEAAAANLPDHQTPGRVGKGAAYNYLAETNIALATLRGNEVATLDKAIAAADEVMKRHSLMKTRFGTRANPASTNTNNGVPAYFPDGDVYFDLFSGGNLDYEEGNTESLWVDQNDINIIIQYAVGGANNGHYAIFIHVPRNAVWRPEWVEPQSGGSPWNGGDVPVDQWGINGSRSAYLGGGGGGTVVPTVFLKTTVWENCGNDLRNDSVNIRRSFPVMATKHSLFGQYIRYEDMDKYLTPATLYSIYPVFSKMTPIDDWDWGDPIRTSRNGQVRDIYIARCSDTYLLRAEAKFRKGDLAGAAADIIEVRGRAQAPLITAADVTLDYILDERARELYGEELRWATLCRMGGSVVNDRIQRYSYATSEAKPALWSGTLANDFLFPIPQSLIDSNLDAVIEQNPMWK